MRPAASICGRRCGRALRLASWGRSSPAVGAPATTVAPKIASRSAISARSCRCRICCERIPISRCTRAEDRIQNLEFGIWNSELRKFQGLGFRVRHIDFAKQQQRDGLPETFHAARLFEKRLICPKCRFLLEQSIAIPGEV